MGECFSRILNYTNGIKSCKASHLQTFWNSGYYTVVGDIHVHWIRTTRHWNRHGVPPQKWLTTFKIRWESLKVQLSQSAFIYSKLAIETLEQVVKYVQS